VVTVSTPPVVQEVVEEVKPIVEVDTPVSKRKNRKINQVEATPSPSVKKSRPRRFVWTLNKVILIFGLFVIITVSLIIYMFKQIA
jgi:hypothetical protein